MLVARVVAARPVGGRDQDVGLALVERRSVDGERDVAERDEPALPPQHRDRVVDEPFRAAGRRHEHGVGTDPIRPRLHRLDGAVGREHDFGPELVRELPPLRA